MEAPDRLLHGVVGDRADVTELLGEDEIGREPLQETLVEQVDAAPAMQCGGDVRVDSMATPAPSLIEGAARDDRPSARHGREVALVRDGDESVLQAEREHDFRRTREERADFGVGVIT